MKHEMIYLKNTNQLIKLSLVAIFLSPVASYASPTETIGFPIPGSACQAYDEAALSGGELIRTTFGIENKGKKNINVYCPVKADEDSTQHYYSLVYMRESSNNIPECYLAFNAYQLRQYKKLTSGGGRILGASINTKRFGMHPITIKCTLQPNQGIVHIQTFRNKK